MGSKGPKAFLAILFIMLVYAVPTSCGLLIDFEHGIPADWNFSFRNAAMSSKNSHEGQQSMMLGPVKDEKNPAEASLKLEYPAYVEFWWEKSNEFDSISELKLIYDNKSLLYESTKWKNKWGNETIEVDNDLLLKFQYESYSTHPDSVAWIDDINITYKFNPPSIKLISPEKNQTMQLDEYNNIVFTYELPSIKGFSNFKTYLSRENTSEYLIHQLPFLDETAVVFLHRIEQPGNYTWFVSCEGTGKKKYESEKRYFALKVPPMSTKVITPKNICTNETFRIRLIMNSSEEIYGVKSLNVKCNNSGFKLIDIQGDGFFEDICYNSSLSVYQSMYQTKADHGSLNIDYRVSPGSNGGLAAIIDDIVLTTANGEMVINPVEVQIDIPKKFTLSMRNEYENEYPYDENNINSLYDCSC